MSRQTFIIGSKEYAASKIPAFQANQIILKLQKLILPVIGEVVGGGLDRDMRVIAETVSQKLDESVMADIIMPMFKLAQVASVTDNVKIDSEVNFNKVFTADDLGDFYELVYEVLNYNFGNFIAGLIRRFGNSVGDPVSKD